MKKLCPIFASMALFGGCSAANALSLQDSGITFELNPASLQISADTVLVNNAQSTRTQLPS